MEFITKLVNVLELSVEAQLTILFSAILIIILTIICLTIIKKNKDKD